MCMALCKARLCLDSRPERRSPNGSRLDNHVVGDDLLRDSLWICGNFGIIRA